MTIHINKQDEHIEGGMVFLEKFPTEKAVIPIFIRKIDGSRPSAKEIMDLYDGINNAK